MSSPDNKSLVLGLISTTRTANGPKGKPVVSKQIAAAVEPDPQTASQKKSVTPSRLRALMIKAESKDPIAGKRFRDKSKVTTGIYIRQDVHRTLKLLAAIEGKKFNSYIEDAIDEYLEKIADRIPDVT